MGTASGKFSQGKLICISMEKLYLENMNAIETEKANGKPDIRNRIIEIRRMKLGDVAANPNNWRGHPDEQRATFNGLVREIGWAGMPLVYKSARTGRLTYVDGHLRSEQLPEFEADVAVTDLSDDEADMLLVMYDPLARMASTDAKLLSALMGQIKTNDKNIAVFIGNLAEREGIIPPDVEFREYDESIADGIQLCKCERCGHEHAANKSE